MHGGGNADVKTEHCMVEREREEREEACHYSCSGSAILST